MALIEDIRTKVANDEVDQWVETGEQFFAPETVERIHAIVRGERQPSRTILTPVYDFAA